MATVFEMDVLNIINSPKTILGAFRFKIGESSLLLRFIEILVNIRSIIFKLPYGDQAFFLRKKFFNESGCFLDISIMEDFAFVLKLRRIGKTAISRKYAVTSSRRWRRLGIIKTILINQAAILAYIFGVSPDRINKWYNI